MVKEGYKQTEIGIIPEDWDLKQIKNFTDCTAGGTPSTQISEFWEGSIPWMNSGELHQKLVFDVDGRITKIGLQNSSTKILPKNCVLIGLAGQGKTRGTVAINKIELCTNQSIAAVFPNDKFEYSYLFYNLQSRYGELRSISTGDGGRGGLNLTIIRELNIPFPPLPEQRAIATALSDVDALLASLDKLIAKKRAIKTATMQELLTGKTRLEGFEGEWKTKSIEEISWCLDNVRIPLNEYQRNQMKGDIPYCGANGIVDYVNDYVIDDDIILIAEDGGYFDEFATRPIAYRIKGKCWVNNHAHILKAKDNTNQIFLFYSLEHADIQKHLASGTRAKLNKSEMYKIEISMPLDKREQQAIALVLEDIDSEILAIETRRAKTQAIKEGMMQELLTGRTRLI